MEQKIDRPFAGQCSKRSDHARHLQRPGHLPTGAGTGVRPQLAVPGPRKHAAQGRRFLHHLHGGRPEWWWLRQKDGSIEAYMNQCRHRGMRCAMPTAATPRPSPALPRLGLRPGRRPDLGAPGGAGLPQQARQVPLGHDPGAAHRQLQGPDLRQLGRRGADPGRVHGRHGLVSGRLPGSPGGRHRGPGRHPEVGHRVQLEVRRRTVLQRPVPCALHPRLGHPGAAGQPGNKSDGKPLGEGQTPARCGPMPWGACSCRQWPWQRLLLHEKPDANVWVDGEVSRYFRDTFPEAEQRLGKVRALRLAGHNTLFPTLSWAQRYPDPAHLASPGPNKIEVWAFCIGDRDAPVEVKDALIRSHARGLRSSRLPGAGRFGELCGGAKGAARPQGAATDFCVQMGLGFEERRNDGIPGVTNYTFARNGSPGLLPALGNMMSADSWSEIHALTEANQKETVHG